MLLLALLLVAATTFSDSQERFNILLPEGWSQTVIASNNTDSVAFKRQDDKLLANILIHVMPAEPNTSLRKLAVASGKILTKTAGYKLLTQGEAKLGKLKAFRRRYIQTIDFEGKWQKISEDRWAIDNNNVFMIHVETLAESFAHFEDEFKAIFQSFKIGALDVASDDILLDSPIVGHWIMVSNKDSSLILRSDGTLESDGKKGTYTVLDDNLQMRLLVSGYEQQFKWQLFQNKLLIMAPNSDEPFVYRQATEADKEEDTKK
ncbi:MAG: hypothetical protein JW841_05385 [Deltaproteobacteria bacterium]|nr:hypothetical protein [Deltaproteobacteria bacterium]